MGAEDRARVIEHARAHPDEAAFSIAKRFDLNRRTVSRWLKAANLARPPRRGNGTPDGTAEPGSEAKTKPKATRKARAKGGGDGTRSGGTGGKTKPPPSPTSARANPRPAAARASRATSPAVTLPLDDRDKAVQTVRHAREVVARDLAYHLAQLNAWELRQADIEAIDDPEARLDARKLDPRPEVTDRQARAWLALQKQAAEALGSHAGLMELADAGKGDTAEDQKAVDDRLAAALGLRGTK